MDDLSRLCGVSKGMLSQIEQSKTNPTVAVLLRIAHGLGIEPTRLLPAHPSLPRVWRIIRSEDKGALFPANPGCTIRTLSPLNLEKQIELYELTFKPAAKLVSEPHYNGTEEVLSVVQGEVTVRSGKNETHLKKGDSAHYAADLPHAISNAGSSQAVCILLVWYHA